MAGDFVIRECRSTDLEQLIYIWQEVGLTLGISDSEKELNRLLERNPETCLVCEVNGVLVGGVMGGFDGRRGLVHHLAVDPAWQRCGYGRALMEELDKRYLDMGVVKYSFWIEERNRSAIDFYRRIGYDLRDLITMSKTLR